MISVSSSASLGQLTASQKSLKFVAVVLLLFLGCQTSSASPLNGRPSSTSNSDVQLESKSRSPEVVVVEDDSSSAALGSLPLTMESLENRLVAKQPPVRMLRSSAPQMFYEEDEETPSVRIGSPASTAEQEQQLSHLLAQYFRLTNGGSGSNRLPRRVSSTSKRAAAMGVDLPDYILHINKGRNFDFSTFREKMQKSG